MLPDSPRRRRWAWLLVCTLLGFAGGVAAGPTLTDQARALVERAYSILGISFPKAGEKVKLVEAMPTHAPAAPSVVPLPSPPPGGEEAPMGEERGEASAAAAVAPRAESATAPGRPQTAGPGMPVARAPHTKSEAKPLAAKAAPTRTAASPQAAAPAPAGFEDPFVDGTGLANQPKATALVHKPKPSFDAPAATAKSEPAPKPAAATSHDPLDNLMADVVTDTKGKGKAREGKGLDAMLKDVQKSKPEAESKSEAPAPPPPLSQADISRVMAGVKTRSQECGRQLGQKGIAELKLAVGKNGSVTDVRIGGKVANTPLAACIQKAVRAASFPPSAGLRFDYQIDVR